MKKSVVGTFALWGSACSTSIVVLIAVLVLSQWIVGG